MPKSAIAPVGAKRAFHLPSSELIIGPVTQHYPTVEFKLEVVDGKTINLNITGEPDITIALEKRLKSDYPDVNWTTKKTYGIDPVRLTEEEMKTTEGVIMGVCW